MMSKSNVISTKIKFGTQAFYNILLVAFLLSIACWDMTNDAGWVVCFESAAVWEVGITTVLLIPGLYARGLP